MNKADIIKKRRLELDLTYEDIGKFVGVGKSTVRKWEKGLIKDIGSDKLGLLADILQISPLVFFDTKFPALPKTASAALSEPELRVIKKYRQLNAGDKEDVEDFIDLKIMKQNKKVENSSHKVG